MTDLSIIIPVFNRQSLGERAIRSALAQEVADAEIIVVDDCSEPAFRLPPDLAATPHIRVLRHPVNSGAAAARNTAIEAARGEWLAFLDSDDLWAQGTLPPRLEMAKVTSSSLVAHAAGFSLRHAQTGRDETRIPRPSADPRDFASGCWFSPGSTLIVRREAFRIVGPYDPALTRLEDLDWFLRLALAGGRLERWPQVAALIDLGAKPSLAALEQAAARLAAKYFDPASPLYLPPGLVQRLKAYLDVERASIHAAARRWPQTMFYIARSFMRVPRLTLHLKRFWD